MSDTCANCGKEPGDAVRLKSCTACRLVKYCSVDCQRTHRKQHKKTCKQRAAELRDEQLYSQGLERPEGDSCPIFTLPIPFPMNRYSALNGCCMKRTCSGCVFAVTKRGMFDCAFCRSPPCDNLAVTRDRVAKKDPAAILFLGQEYFFGLLGLKKDTRKAVELWTEAADLGSVEALYNLGNVYSRGDGVQQDKAKASGFYEKAAMQGHVESRHNLGCIEGKKGEHGRAVRHFLISANMGYKKSVETIKVMFMNGEATKDKYAEALKGYQGAVEEMQSHDRDEAHAYIDNDEANALLSHISRHGLITSE